MDIALHTCKLKNTDVDIILCIFKLYKTVHIFGIIELIEYYIVHMTSVMSCICLGGDYGDPW